MGILDKKYPGDKPEFLCGSCSRLMCEDCQSIAAEYEFLYIGQKRELALALNQLEKAKHELKIAQKRADDYERVAKLGFADVMIGYLDWLATGGDASLQRRS